MTNMKKNSTFNIKLLYPIVGVLFFSFILCVGLVEAKQSIENYATIEAYVGKDEVPVYAFGHLTYVYGLSPDLLPVSKIQAGSISDVLMPLLDQAVSGSPSIR